MDHLRKGDLALVEALDAGDVVTHPFVIGEIACGWLRHRTTTLQLLRRLPSAPIATQSEALAFIEAHELGGRGIGWVDVHLLASAALSNGFRLRTLDRRLAEVAREMKLGD